MVSFNKFFTSVFLAVVYGSTALALVTAPEAKHATHRVREVGKGLKVVSFHPESSFEVFLFLLRHLYLDLLLLGRPSAKALITP